MLEYDIKGAGVILSIRTREAFGQDSGGVILVSDPRAECAGPARGSVENNSRVMLARLASDPLLAGHDLTRPVSSSSPLDPTRPDPRALKAS